jgi:outer membrane receptor protein involved in Fe transport
MTMKTSFAKATAWTRRSQFLVAGLSAIVLTAATAQSQTDEAVDDDVVDLQAFTVLGSSITRFDEESGLPVTQFDMDMLEIEGFSSSGEIFSELVFTGSPEFDEASDGPNNARGDVTSINLRGAGPGQTLVLLNGRRLAPHPMNQTVGQTPSTLVNANVIPAGLIDRIDVLRDGASAIYGTDASAGVVNTQLEQNFLGSDLRFRYGMEETGDFDEMLFSYSGGFDFNEGRTNLSVFLSYFERDPIYAKDREYARNGDKRPLVDEKWRGDVSIINVSSGSTYSNLETDLPGSRDQLKQDGVNITDSTGRFHLVAPQFEDSTTTLVGGQRIDSGTLSREAVDRDGNETTQRYDFAPFVTLTSEVERTNLFFNLNHEISDNVTLYGEFGYYHSETFQTRAAVVIGTSDGIVIPADNYWNPFGPVNFANGSANPNRLSGITLQNGDPLPDEGIDIQLDGWRAEDLGLRLVDVESDSYLFTAGLKGKAFEDWYWDTGVRYHLNEATDTSSNRLSKTGLSEALADDSPGALNVFAGPGSNDPADFGNLLIEVARTAETELLSYDLRVNNPDVIRFFGNPVGIAFGAEARKETYLDDRDPRIDGTIRFDDTDQGRSDVIGVSPTSDSESDRKVMGAYGEILFPLVGEGNRIGIFHRVEFQIAGRWEDYDDFGSITRPKYGFFWYLTEGLLVRSSMAKGFTAPNLSILTDPIQRFNTGVEDDYRLQWDPDNSQNDGSEQIADLRGGNFGLGPETSKTQTAGIVWRVPWVKGLTLTTDYYNIKISDRIGTVGTNDILNDDEDALNALSADPANYSPGDVVIGDPRVERGPLTQELIDLATSQGFAPAGPIERVLNPFVNEASRAIHGWDFGAEYQIPTDSLGSFTIDATASYLQAYRDIEIEGDNPDNQIKDEINPRLRANVALKWQKGPWRAGVSTVYMSETIDNDVDADDGEEWIIDDYMRVSVNGSYRFDEGMLEGLRVTVGIRNLFNEEPSLNPDESRGYETSLHSNRERYYYVDLRYSF